MNILQKIFPDPRKQGDIHFLIAKKLPYHTRMKLILLCLCLGLLIQMVAYFWIGLAFLIIGTGLSLIKGYTDKPQITGREEWNQITPDEYSKVKKKQAQLKKWDRDMFDITNPLGMGIFILIASLCAIGYLILQTKGENALALYWACDAGVLLAPHWITGIRGFLKKDRLIIKIDLLEKIMGILSAPSDLQVLPMLSTQATKEGGRIPMDARLMIRLINAPDYFLGMQIQISLNNVQGKFYPYLYCVLIAKKEEGLFKKQQSLLVHPPKNLTFEKTVSADVDVLVIRQTTTENSGYHTNLKASTFIVQSSLDLARKLIKAAP